MFLSDSKSQFVRRFLAPEVSYNPVAFYANISKDVGGVGANHIFLYDTEVTNQGNGYSKHTGAFTAPSTGLYAFCYTAFASGEHVFGESGDYGEVSVQLVHNGAYKGSIYVDTETHREGGNGYWVCHPHVANRRCCIDQVNKWGHGFIS